MAKAAPPKAAAGKKTAASKTITSSPPKKSTGKTILSRAGTTEFTAKKFIQEFNKLQSDEELRKIQRYFKSGEGQYGAGDTVQAP